MQLFLLLDGAITFVLIEQLVLFIQIYGFFLESLSSPGDDLAVLRHA